MKYADRPQRRRRGDRRHATRRAEGKVTIKDLVAGAEAGQGDQGQCRVQGGQGPASGPQRGADLVAELGKIPAVATHDGGDLMAKSPGERRAAMVRLVESRTVTRVAPPLLLPASPYLELAGEEFGRNLLLTTANNGIEYCLRPDFTLPIAKSYLDDGMTGVPGAYTYLGPIFRQENGVPVEYEQAGLELLGQPDADAALDQVLTFARWALAIYDITAPNVRIGGVGLFESFLAANGHRAAMAAAHPSPLRPPSAPCSA